MLEIRGALFCFQLVADYFLSNCEHTIFVWHPPVLWNVRRAPVEYKEENNNEVGNDAIYRNNFDHKVLFAQCSLTT